ncbi:nucleotidyltransferase domain-containing protein [Brassicibacter mesophilus]
MLFNNPQIVFAYVFGSYARNKLTDKSDIDFAIL